MLKSAKKDRIKQEIKMGKHVLGWLIAIFIFIFVAPALGKNTTEHEAADQALSALLNQSIIYERGPEWEDSLNPDGSHTRKIYTGIKNYWNGTAYEPIDTTVVEENGAFKVEKGAYKVRWDNSKTLRFKKDNYFFIYQSKEISHGKPKRILASIREREGQKNKNKIKFKEIYPSIDVEYIYYPDLLKENIIINKAPDSPSQNDTLDFSGYIEYSNELEIWVNGTKQEANFSTSEAIEFRAGGKVEFTLLPPVIEDSNNSRITGDYELVMENGKNQLSVKVPYEWLINSSRVYPVIVDPSISIRNSADTFVDQWTPDKNYGRWGYLEIKSWAWANERILIRFPLTSSLPPGATITSAALKMFSNYSDSGRTIEVWSAGSLWDERTVTWNNQPPHITKLSSGSSGLGLRSWSITEEVVSKWGKYLFLKLMDSNEGYFGIYGRQMQRYYSWEEHEINASAQDPFLEITYTTPQNDCNLGSDASNTFDGANSISLPKTCSGYLEFPDISDYYRFSVTSGYTIDASLTPPSGANFNLYLYDPNNILKTWSIRTGDSSESISYAADSSGEWRIEAYRYNGSGTYSLSVARSDKTPPLPPVISSFTHPDQKIWYNNKDPSFTWTAPQDVSGIAGYSYILDNLPSTTPDETVNTTGNSASYSNIADGVWYFHVRAKDKPGNWGDAAHYKVNIDVTPPPAPAISSSTHPDQGKWYTNNNPSFTWITPSDNSGIAGYGYGFDRSSSTIPAESVDTTGNSKAYSSQSDGTWYFHVRAKDKAGNWGDANHYRVNIDLTPPSISISSPVNNSVLINSSVPVSWSGSDSGSGISRYEIQLDGNGWINKGPATSHTFDNVSHGPHTIYVKAVDNVANQATTSVSFTVQSLPDLYISSEDITFVKVG